MNVEKLESDLYEFIAQSRILKFCVDVSEYFIYLLVVLMITSSIISFGELADTVMYYAFFVLFVLAFAGQKYVGLVVLFASNILCSVYEVFWISIYGKVYYSRAFGSVFWGSLFSILGSLFLMCLFYTLLKRKNNKSEC